MDELDGRPSHVLKEPTADHDQVVASHVLNTMVSASSGLLNLAAVAQLAVDHVGSLLLTDGVALYWWDDTDELLVPLACSGLLGLTALPVVRAGQGLVGTAFLQREPVVHDADNRRDDDDRWQHSTSFGIVGMC